MKKTFLLLFVFTLVIGTVKAQSIPQLLAQLAFDIQKLAELKNILTDMYKSYEIIDKGYNDVKNIAEGNFNLHEVFLDGLLAVSPAVKNYERVADIMNAEYTLISEYKSAFVRLQSNGHFTTQELDYISSVYSSLASESLKNLDELVTVITAGKLRMSDDERIGAIDRIYTDMSQKLGFLRTFNRNNSVQALHRARDAGDVDAMKSFYDLH